MGIIGRIRNEYVQEYWGEIIPEVVLTEERIGHIREGHAEDYDALSQYISGTIENPDYILDDARSINTGMFIKCIDAAKGINVIVKLECENSKSLYMSSVITMYRLGRGTLKRLLKKYRVVYKSPKV